MYYTVKLNKKTYVSKEIVKHLLKIGDAGLLRETASGNLKAVQIMSVTVYEIPKDKLEALDVESMGIVCQDLDDAVKSIAALPADARLITSAKGCENVYSLDGKPGHMFIELRDLVYARKYQIQEDIPCLDVCGTRYIAVNAVKKGCTDYISL